MESSSEVAETERRLRTDQRVLPRTPEELVDLFKRTIDLPGLQKIEVTPTQFVVQRMVSDGEAVIPSGEESSAVDPTFLLTTLQKGNALHVLPFAPDRHPHMSLLEATDYVTGLRLRPTFLIAPEGEWLGAFLGLDEKAVPSSCFGMKVIYTRDESFADKILVLGGPTTLLTDVACGVVIDIGV
jgi:hypothetical protein